MPTVPTSSPRSAADAAREVGSVRTGLPATPWPEVSPTLIALFSRYAHWYLRRHFHAVRLSTQGWQPSPSANVARVLYLNHASWWDPLVCLQVWNQCLRAGPSFALIDAEALKKYAFFRKLGFIGIEPDSRRGAATFLRVADALARLPGGTLWVTPQARFADVRERPLQFRPGLGHLALRAARSSASSASPPMTVELVPLALEYTHWEERTQEVLVRFGQPIRPAAFADTGDDATTWTRRLEAHLEETMDALAKQAIGRDPIQFSDLLKGRAGVGLVYDAWRRLRAGLRGRDFNPNHGTL